MIIGRRKRRSDVPKMGYEPRTQLVGCVGTDGTVRVYPEAADVEIGPIGSMATVARIIRGDCLGREFNGWILLYDDLGLPPTQQIIGKLCAMELEDGRLLVKILRRGQNRGRFDLFSVFDPPIRDVALVWAMPILAAFPAYRPNVD